MIYRYPQQVHDFVKENAPKMRDRMLAEECNKALGTQFTASTMKAFRGNHGYRNGKKQWTTEEYWQYQTRYPQGMYEFIRDNSWNVSSKDMANMVNEKFGQNFTPSGMKQFRQRHGIRSGLTGWYQKGHSPGTKGKTIEEICKHDPEKLEKVRATWFKKGDRPKNEMPVGTIVTNSEGYMLRKKQMEGSMWERWELLHRAVWEEHNGPVPEGMIVIFKDGNRKNCDISNLMMVSRGELAAMAKKGYRFKDPDLTETAANIVRLQIRANKIKRKQQTSL